MVKMIYPWTMPSVSVIIPAHNEERYIEECLRSVLRASEGSLDIIVVDNASSDQTAQRAVAFKNVRVVREERKGTSFARQRGLDESSAEFLLFLDADSRLQKNWVKRASSLLKDPKTVCASGPYLCYDLPWYWNAVSLCYWWLLAFPASLLTGSVAVGGSMLIRRSALVQAGGFDTSITFFGDDTNTAKRLSCFGKVRFDPLLISYSSARRFRQEGLIKTAWTYACNYLSQIFTGTSVTTSNRDLR